jgi:hypothetical protein
MKKRILDEVDDEVDEVDDEVDEVDDLQQKIMNVKIVTENA